MKESFIRKSSDHLGETSIFCSCGHQLGVEQVVTEESVTSDTHTVLNHHNVSWAAEGL